MQFHHQKPIYPFRTMIDTDRLKKANNQKRRSNAGLQPQQPSSLMSTSTHHHRSASPNNKIKIEQSPSHSQGMFRCLNIMFWWII